MKIVLAPDSFKESLTALQVCDAMEQGIRLLDSTIEIIKIPLADGGEGTVATLIASTQGTCYNVNVTGPLGEPVEAEYGITGDGRTAVMEMASASGLSLVPLNKRNPSETTTLGTGQLIKHILDRGIQNIIIGIGGSATNDCGAGMAQALGIRFFSDGKPISDYMCGKRLINVSSIDFSSLHPHVKKANIQVACDVDNPLLGQRGAGRIYAPQKGADAQMVDELEAGMRHFIEILEKQTRPVRDIPGAGAAGGLGAGLMAFLDATPGSGINIILDACRFTEKIQAADLILTGEGKIDGQSAMGKTLAGVLARATAANVPVIALAGSIDNDSDIFYEKGLVSMFSICDRPMSLPQALNQAPELITKTTERILRCFTYGIRCAPTTKLTANTKRKFL